jgi:hypothetical protein
VARKTLLTTVRIENDLCWCIRKADAYLLRFADARGHYTIGKELVDNVVDRIRRVAGAFKVFSDQAL